MCYNGVYMAWCTSRFGHFVQEAVTVPSPPAATLESTRVPNLVPANIAMLKMAIEIVDLPIKNGDFP